MPAKISFITIDQSSVKKDGIPVKTFEGNPVSEDLLKDLEFFFKATEASQDSEEFKKASEDDFLINLGKQLFDTLFCVNGNRSDINDKECLALDIRDDFLKLLPWELMHNGKHFIAPRGGIFRVFDSEENLNFQPAQNRLKITAAFASPILNPELKPDDRRQPYRLKFGPEIASLKEIKEAAADIHIENPVYKSSFPDLCEKSDILLFSGHGNKGFLSLENRFGESAIIDTDFFDEYAFDHNLKLILFNSCLTASVTYDKKANELISVVNTFMKLGVPLSIGMQFSITETAGYYITENLINGLCDGDSILKALQRYRSKIRIDEKGLKWDWAAPILYVHKSIAENLHNLKFVENGTGNTDFKGNERADFIELRRDELFVGRRKELVDIAKNLDFEDNAKPTTCIVKGMGGNGKSALAVEYANRFSHFYREIIWISARDARPSDDILEHTVGMDELAIKRDPKNFLEELVKKVEQIELKGEETEKDIRDSLLRRLDDGEKRLIIMDNMESFQDIGVISHLLNNLSRNNRVLITSRELLKGVEHSLVEVFPFKEEDSIQMLEQYVRLKNYSIPGNLLELIHEKTGGHPLTMRLFVSYLASLKKDWKKIEEDLKEMKGEPFDYVLKKSVEAAGEKGNYVLTAMTLFRPDCSFEALKAVSGIENFEEVFKQLRDLSLVETYGKGERFGLQELVKQYASKELTDKGYNESLLPRFSEFYYELVESKGWVFSPHKHKNELQAMFEEALKNMPEELKSKITIDMYTNMIYQLTLKEFEAERHNLVFSYDLLLNEENAEKLKGFLNDISTFFKIKAYWGDYIQILEKALTLFEKINDEKSQAVSLNNLGLFYQSLGEWDKTLQFYEESLKIKERLGDEHGMASTYINLGTVYDSKGEWDKALEYYEKSLEIKERQGDEHGMASTYNNMGLVYKSQGEWDKALQFHEKALEISKRLGDEHGMAQICNNMGGVYYSKGEWDKALYYYEKSLKISERLGDEHGMASTYGNMAGIYRNKGEHQKAGELYAKQLDMAKKMGDVQGEALALWGIANIWYITGKKEEAKITMGKALKIFEKIGDRPNVEEVKWILEKWNR